MHTHACTHMHKYACTHIHTHILGEYLPEILLYSMYVSPLVAAPDIQEPTPTDANESFKERCTTTVATVTVVIAIVKITMVVRVREEQGRQGHRTGPKQSSIGGSMGRRSSSSRSRRFQTRSNSNEAKENIEVKRAKAVFTVYDIYRVHHTGSHMYIDRCTHYYI
eukprot:GHVU01085331.1.p1 GENE.GHVU01085331.1~~GHVU01085331.1.p1  ORF type:complete len:165 (+),score=10.19 GHVU01085331.1:38-532(+)